MQIRILLPKQVVDYWQQYGTLSQVVSHLDYEQLTDLPPQPPYCDQQLKKVITIDPQSELAELISMYGSHSNRVSVARILSYYYELDYASEHNWPLIATPLRHLFECLEKEDDKDFASRVINLLEEHKHEI